MKVSHFRILGRTGLIMHNVRLANPLDPIAQKIATLTGKKARDKTPEVHQDIAYLEFQGGIYWDAEVGPYIPGRLMKAVIVEAAKSRRKGATIDRSLDIPAPKIPLEYKGPRHWEELWEATAKDGTRLFVDGRNMNAGRGKVWRTRPLFPPPWSAEFDVEFDESALSPEDVLEFLRYAGAVTGMMDDRPTGGRFDVEGPSDE